MAISLLYQKMIQGGFLYFGNALGLTKGSGAIIPGTLPTQGAFITTDTTAQAVGGWPSGTTLDWKEGNSYCYVDIPAGNVIDEAFLIWGGSTGSTVGSAARLYPVYMITPDNIKHVITPVSTMTGTGFYSSSANVTSIVSAFTSGNFICGSIPADITPAATAGEGGGWILALAVISTTGAYNYSTLCISNDNYVQVGTNIPIVTPSTGVVTGKLMVGVIDAACSAGDALILQNTRPFSAPYREAPNFFNSIISNNSTDGLPYTNASFGTSNNSPLTRSNNLNARQGLDLAIFKTSGDISPNTSSYYLDGYAGGVAFSPLDGNTNYIAYGSAMNPSNATTTLEKLVDKGTAQYGDTVVYTLRIVLEGSGTVAGIRVFDTMPDNATFVPGSININGVNNPSANLTTGILLATSANLPYSATITYSALINSSGGFQNVNNSFYVTFTNTISTGVAFTNTVVSTFAVTTIINSAQLNVSKYVSSNYGTINDILTYTIALNNSGNLQADTAIFIDTIPNGVTLEPNTLFVDGVANTSTTNPINIDLSPFPVGAIRTITFKVKVTNTVPTPNPIVNNSYIGYEYVDNSSLVNTSNISNNTITTISYGELYSNKIVDKNYGLVGDIITYTIPIGYNFGNTTIVNVVLIDTIPATNTLVPNSLKLNGVNVAGSLSAPGINIGTIPINGLSTVTFQVVVTTVPNPNPIPNSALINYGYIANPSLPAITSALNTNVVNTYITNSNMQITKAVDKVFATVGESIKYTLTITNAGNVTADNSVLYDTIPTGTSYITNTLKVNGVLAGGDPSNISLNSINPNEVVTVEYMVLIN